MVNYSLVVMIKQFGNGQLMASLLAKLPLSIIYLLQIFPGSLLWANRFVSPVVLLVLTLCLCLSQAADLFAAACADGTYRFISRSGREEKKIQAHEGAVICISWSHDGAALLTAGEEGDVKIWSRSGNMRSILASTGQSVYCACWGPDDDQIVFACGLSILSLPLSSPLSLSLCLSLSVSVSLSRQHSYDQNCPS
jgi:WD40 repeat protein